MPLPLSDLQRLVDRFDPEQPLEARSPFYIPFDSAPSVRGSLSCVEALKRTIVLAGKKPSCQLFTGFPGTGKTTELLRLAAALHEAPQPAAYAVYIDFEEFIDIYNPPTITDIVRVLAYCLDREATRAEGKDVDATQGYGRRLFGDLAKTSPELKQLGFEAFGASLMLEFKNNPSFRTRAEDAMRSRFQHFVQEARKVMSESIVRIRSAIGSKADRLVVIADGLEKFRPIRDEDRSGMESAVEAIFLSHQDLLRIPCHVVYTFPVWLRFRSTPLGAGYSREPLILPMVKIRGRDGEPSRDGIAKLQAMVRQRLSPTDPAQVFGEQPDAALWPLIAASGGYPRDLLRMIRSLLMDYDLPLRAEHVEQVIKDLKRSYHNTVLGTYTALLAQVARTQSVPNADSNQLALFSHLFGHFLIFAYHNGEEWFDVHPLIRDAPYLKDHIQPYPDDARG
jgi:hypothetical protein